MSNKLIKFVATITLLLPLWACVQMPTEKQGVSDLRPQISFNFDRDNQRSMNARVHIDGVDVGSASEFFHGANSLKINSGTHLIKVVRDGEVVLDERFYIGDGVSKSFMIK